MAKLAVVGSAGIVGSALSFAFKKLGHMVIEHDLKLGTKLEDCRQAEVTFVAVPTPMNKDGSCDTSIVRKVVEDLYDSGYMGIVAIKSTVPPQTTQHLIHDYGNCNFKVCFCPEFLRERVAVGDASSNLKILVVGTDDDEVYRKVVEVHGKYPWATAKMAPTSAELLKYMHNFVNAMRVVVANEFYELAQKLGANYKDVKEALLHSTGLPDEYLDVSPHVRGYSSICFNKDIPAIIKVAESLGLDLPLLKTVPVANDKYKKTPFANTRETY